MSCLHGFFPMIHLLSYLLCATNFILDASCPYSWRCWGGDARHFPLSPPEFSIALLSAAPGDPTPSESSAEEHRQWGDRTQYNPSVPFTQFEASLRFIYYTAPSVSVHVFSLSRLGSWDDTMIQLFLFCCCDQTPSPEAGMMPQH